MIFFGKIVFELKGQESLFEFWRVSSCKGKIMEMIRNDLRYFRAILLPGHL